MELGQDRLEALPLSLPRLVRQQEDGHVEESAHDGVGLSSVSSCLLQKVFQSGELLLAESVEEPGELLLA